MDGYEGRRVRYDEAAEPTRAPMPGGSPMPKGQEPPASMAFRRLSNNIDELDACLADLISKIGPVLSPDAGDEPGTEPYAPGSVMTNMINEKADHVYRLTRVVNDVFRRVEV